MVLTTTLLETFDRCLMRIGLAGCLLVKPCIGPTQRTATRFQQPDANGMVQDLSWLSACPQTFTAME